MAEASQAQCGRVPYSINLSFINICNEVKDLLFAAPPQIERIPNQQGVAFKPKRRCSD
jgi:hypothetical protein